MKKTETEEYDEFIASCYRLCDDDKFTDYIKIHLQFILHKTLEKEKKEFIKTTQNILHNLICDVQNANSTPKESLYNFYVKYDGITPFSFENNVQLGKYFKEIEYIFRRFEHFKDLEIDQEVVYRYLAKPALYKRRDYRKHDNKDIPFLYFSLSFCLSMYENFNSEPIQPNFEEDYTLEMNRILIKNYLIPTYLLFNFRKDTI